MTMIVPFPYQGCVTPEHGTSPVVLELGATCPHSAAVLFALAGIPMPPSPPGSDAAKGAVVRAVKKVRAAELLRAHAGPPGVWAAAVLLDRLLSPDVWLVRLRPEGVWLGAWWEERGFGWTGGLTWDADPALVPVPSADVLARAAEERRQAGG